MNDELHYERAKERVRAIKGVYIHIFVYLVVNLGLVIINLITNPKQLWFYWPLAGWGLGLLAHAFSVLIIGGLFGKDWEEKQIAKLMAKVDEDEEKS